MKKILVTGANGFVGQHLAKELKDNNYYVMGIGGNIGLNNKPENIDEYIVVDLSNKDEVGKIDFSSLDGIVHLAGLAAVGPSFENPMQYIDVNIGIEVNLFEACRSQNSKPKFIIISSGTIYSPDNEMPLNEKSSVLPNSPYAVSKLGQEDMAKYYESIGFEVVTARPFNHIGPGQGLGFIVPDLTKQIVDFKNGDSEEVMVGNLDSERDYTDVRDIARAYRLLLEDGKSGEIYNICTGSPTSGKTILDALIKIADVAPKITLDKSRLRPSDNPVVFGDYKKINNDTGWNPKISLDTTLKDIIFEKS
jgi:GDP-4-dehydro-6-deoxy-D-mannose reductase